MVMGESRARDGERGSVLSIARRTVIVSEKDEGNYPECNERTRGAVIAALHRNGTVAPVGMRVLYLEVELFPPRLINCVVTIHEGEESPLT